MKNATKASRCLIALLFSSLVLPPVTEVMARDSTSYNPAAMQVRSSIPIGTIIAWPTNSLPASGTWVECDGRNGTPDLRGRFIRGLGGRSGALGQVQAEETKAHFHTVQQHSHTVTGEASGQEVVVTPQVVSGEASSQQVEVGSQTVSGEASAQSVTVGPQDISGNATGEYKDIHQETYRGSWDRGDSGQEFLNNLNISGTGSGGDPSHSHSVSYDMDKRSIYAQDEMRKFNGDVKGQTAGGTYQTGGGTITGQTAGGTYETKGGTITGKTAGGTYMTGGGTITGVTNMAGNNTDYTGGIETRPENVALRYIMKIR